MYVMCVIMRVRACLGSFDFELPPCACVCVCALGDPRHSLASGLQMRGSPSALLGAAPEPSVCPPRPAAEGCSTTEDGAEPLLCPSGYECHILSPGDLAAGIPNRGQCVKQRKPAGECGHQAPPSSPWKSPVGDPSQRKARPLSLSPPSPVSPDGPAPGHPSLLICTG